MVDDDFARFEVVSVDGDGPRAHANSALHTGQTVGFEDILTQSAVSRWRIGLSDELLDFFPMPDVFIAEVVLQHIGNLVVAVSEHVQMHRM